MKTRSLCIVIVLVFMVAMIPCAHAAVIAAKPSPNADFTGTPQSGYAPLTVLFNATSNGTGPLTFAWDFGDGSNENATVMDPVHTFVNVGSYDVSLTVSNPVSSTTTLKTGYITVSAPPVAPIADFSGTPLSGAAPLTVTFIDNSTGTVPLIWTWDFGDGSNENATLQNPVHTFTNVGTFNVSLTVSNVAGSNTTTRTDYITVSAAPVADFTGSPQSGTAPLTVTFTDVSSGTEPLTFAWNFGDGSNENATVKDPVHTYTSIGIYNVSLMVSNAVGSNTTTKTDYISVSEPPIAPTADFTGSPQSGPAPLTVTFTDVSSGTEPLTFAWNFGDGSNENATVQSPVHTYTNVGTYDVSLEVSNVVGNTTMTKTGYITVTAAPVAPIADFIGTPLSGPAPLTVTFFDNSTGTDPLTYFWDFGDGSNATQQVPVHTYTNAGVYNVSLTATNAVDSNTTIKTNYITVSAVLSSNIGVFRPARNWYLDASGDGAWGPGDSANGFGMAGDIPVKGDWNNDGKTEIGVFRGGHSWYLDTSGDGAWGAGDTAYGFGIAGDIPVTGDWNVDGKTEIGVFRGARSWYLDTSGDGAWGAGDSAYGFGIAGDIPITGDWNMDGKTEIGVFRGARSWYLDTSGDGAWGAMDTAYGFGMAGDTPVTGDWNADGKTEIGVFRPARNWYLDASGNGAWGAGDSTYAFGIAGDVPVTGTW